MRPLALLVIAMSWLSCNQPVAEISGTDAGQQEQHGDGGTDAGTDAGMPSAVKLLFLFDGSQSLSVTDPNAERVDALFALLDANSQTDLSIAVMVFAGSTSAFLTGQGLPAFVPASSLTTADRDTLRTRLLTFTASTSLTDWVRPLSNAYPLLSNDTSNVANAGLPRAKYAVVFVSDGHPTNDQDDELLCGDAVRRLRSLNVFARDVVVSTVHVFKTQLPQCTVDAGVGAILGCQLPEPLGTCATTVVDLDAERLRRMAQVGGGAFRDFRAGTTVDFAGLVP